MPPTVKTGVRSMSHDLFATLYTSGQPFALIDTRERREHVNGHWFGSTNIPLSVLTQQINRLIPSRDFPVHLLDWQDTASSTARKKLSALGYTSVEHHKTESPDTFGHGYVKGEYVWSKAFGEVVAHTCDLSEVTPAEYLADHKDAHLYDVRPTAEYSRFTIPDSKSLPNSLLLANMEALKNSGETALLHCAGRTRSIIGACTLKAAGYNGPYAIFKGGTQAWQLDGLEREFNAERLFAKESDDVQPAQEFLDRWQIKYTEVAINDLDTFAVAHAQEHLFDVSNDAATGQAGSYGITKLSGTNLIQQTDRSIARYHVPVVLFDIGSGSRAAFCAYWLKTMGFDVSVAYLKEQLPTSSTPQYTTSAPAYSLLSVDQLMEQQNAGGRTIDFRPSKAYEHSHLQGSQWGNVSEFLNRESMATESIAVIGDDIAHANETARILEKAGCNVTGISGFNSVDTAPDQLQSGTVDSPIDRSTLFAKRHHGNLQDSRDYLAWEEELPGQIDQSIHQRWLELLSTNNNSTDNN